MARPLPQFRTFLAWYPGLAFLVALLTLGLPAAPAQAGCGACDLAQRDCRAQCTGECRGREREAIQGCREACLAQRETRWAACDAAYATCQGHCARAADADCPKTCLEALRGGQAKLRTERKGCVAQCRERARRGRAGCRDLDPAIHGTCLKRVRAAQGTCLRRCNSETAAQVRGRTDQAERCMATCGGG